MSHYETFASIVEQETEHFCTVEQQRQLGCGVLRHTFDDPRWHARISNCGAATVLVQHNLKMYHSTPTQRVITVPPLAPRGEYNQRKFRHVLLTTPDKIIDPTYGQLFRWAGFGSPRNANHDTPAAIFPDNLALIIDLHQPDIAIGALTQALISAREKYPANTTYQPLRNASENQIFDTLTDVYDTTHFAPFTVGAEDNRDYSHLFELSRNSRSIQ